MELIKVIKRNGDSRMLTKLTKGSATGWLAHQSNWLFEAIEQRDPPMPPAWTRLARYSVGMLASLPIGGGLFEHLYREGMDKKEARSVFEAAFIAAAVAVAVGVAVGYFTDRFVRSFWDGLRN